MENKLTSQTNNEPDKIISTRNADIAKWYLNYIKVSPESESSIIAKMLIEDAKKGYGIDFGKPKLKGTISFIDLM